MWNERKPHLSTSADLCRVDLVYELGESVEEGLSKVGAERCDYLRRCLLTVGGLTAHSLCCLAASS